MRAAPECFRLCNRAVAVRREMPDIARAGIEVSDDLNSPPRWSVGFPLTLIRIAVYFFSSSEKSE